MLKNACTVLGLLMVAALPFGCAQNDPDAPEIGGYSTGLVVSNLTAIPDVVQQGSGELVTLRFEVRNRDFEPFPGRNIAFYRLGFDVPLDPTTTYYVCTGDIGIITISSDITDANGLAFGEFRTGDAEFSTDPTCLAPPPFKVQIFRTFIEGKITDPREGEEEAQISDEVAMEHYNP
ncbi:MAG: hypothetical protein U0166_19605 [Acidobacteriota bacterium]